MPVRAPSFQVTRAASLRTRTAIREPGVASIRLRPSATYLITTVFARVGRPSLPATSVAPSRTRYGPWGSGSPAVVPNQSIVPSRLAALLQHRPDAVDVERDPGGLVDPVAGDDPVAAAITVGGEDSGRQPRHRHAGWRDVDPDRVREHDRPVLPLELDPGLVGPFGRRPRPRRPGRSRRRRPDREGILALHQATDDGAVTVDDLDAQPVGLAELERDHGDVRVALADRREDLRHRRPQNRARGQLERLGVGERERRRDKQRRDEGGWRNLATAE